MAYTYLMRNDYRHPGVVNLIDFSNDRTPHRQGYVRSLLDIGRGFELDVTPRYVGALARPNARDYVELDARLGWRSRAVELALVGRNLLHETHHEFSNPLGGPVPVAIQREVLVKGTFRF